MESRIRELEESRIRELEAYLSEAGFEDCTLTEAEIAAISQIQKGSIHFADFSIVDDVFFVTNSHNILKSDIVLGSGTTPYVTASACDNSVMGYISYNNNLKEQGNTILIGGKTMVITYQSEDFFSNDSHNLVLNLREDAYRTENVYLFFVAALKRSLGHKYHWGDSISKSKIKNDIVRLPIAQNGEIDYNFMNTIVSASKKITIQRLKDFIAKEHNAYEKVINSIS